MLAGCASVSTGAGASGLDWRDGYDLLVADLPADFAAAVVRLLREPDLRQRVAEHGAATVRARLDPQDCLLRLATALGRVA